VRAGELNLTVDTSLNKLLVGVALVTLLDLLDALAQVTLLFLMETFLIILVAQVVDDRLPLLDDGEGSVLEVPQLGLAMGIEGNYFGYLGVLKETRVHGESFKDIENRLNYLGKWETSIRVLVYPKG
jgi:hypothetical protein